MSKIGYLLRSTINVFQPKQCPFCGENQFEKIQTKYLVTTLLRCKNCNLMHRHPKDSKEFLEKFYQSDYKVDVQMMTDLPGDDKLKLLKKNCFAELRDFLPHILAVTHNAPEEIKMIDYGCSWGYNVYKLREAGINAEGFELSVPRAEFGINKLAVRIATRINEIQDNNDIFYSSHVIEHLQNINEMIELSKEKLKREGVFMAYCPNGSNEFKKRNPALFKVTWGRLHPNYLDVKFASNMFRNNPYLLLTSDWPYNIEKLKQWDGRSQCVDTEKSGYELLIIAKPNIYLNSN